MTDTEFAAYLRQRKDLVEAHLDIILPPTSLAPSKIHQAMRYAVLGGGKRLRPILALAVADITELPAENVLDTACAVELVHAASLVLDDLPAMDNAQERRGQPTVHIRYGESTAMLTAIALLALAYERVPYSADACGRPETAGLAVQCLAEAMGSRGIVGGQFDDLAFTHNGAGNTELEQAYERKSGALFRAAVLVPARVCGLNAESTHALDTYARGIGLAFQITDDLLDGGASGEDAGKATVVTALGSTAARKRADDLIDSAIASLGPFGDRAAPLRWIAAFIQQRVV